MYVKKKKIKLKASSSKQREFSFLINIYLSNFIKVYMHVHSSVLSMCFPDTDSGITIVKEN